MTKYNSKIDLMLLLPLIFVLVGATIFMVVLQAWIGVIIMALTSVFIAHIFLTTYYIIDSTTLKVRSGYMVNLRIDIGSIKEIEETGDVISSPALSFDRLYVRYNQKSDLIISPKDKDKFIQHLVLLNPSIKVNTH